MKAIFKLAFAGVAFAQTNLSDCAVESADSGLSSGWWASDLDELSGIREKHEITSVYSCINPQGELQGL